MVACCSWECQGDQRLRLLALALIRSIAQVTQAQTQVHQSKLCFALGCRRFEQGSLSAVARRADVWGTKPQDGYCPRTSNANDVLAL